MSATTIEARTLQALQALQNNPNPTRHPTQSDTFNKSRRLTDLEEQILKNFILNLDSQGFPPAFMVLKKWLINCLLTATRHPSARAGFRISSSDTQTSRRVFFRKYDYQRAKREDPTIIRNWFQLVANTIAKYGIRSDDIYNFDETGFVMGMIASGIVVTGSARCSKPKSVQPGNWKWITVVQVINGEGWSTPPFIIGVGQYHLANCCRESDPLGDWAIATTQNGWTDNETGLEWLKHFGRHTTNRSIGSYRLLTKVTTPSNSRDIAMTTRSSGFACHLIRLIYFSPLTLCASTEFFPAFYAAFQATMTEENIKASFKGAGLVPLDP
ncbi:hypothetical protein HOO65_050513 [Ceratocystis lukuohia]|uniref:DDE-1 domain-containing protein n=1 Tax=Ceratocystis lukuohia TaxID=2019550 RepID=A0ABR4MGI9_9PEZI